jgi:hypothetical protein
MAGITLTRPQVNAWRLTQHGLLHRATPDQLLPVVTRLSALHAQVLSAAELQAAARVDGLAPTAIRDALWTDRTLVKTWAMRGTMHLLTAAEYPLIAAALHMGAAARYEPILKILNVTSAEMDAITAAVRAALDGQCLTREALADAVARQTGQPELRDKLRSGWGSLLKPAAYQGYLCFGPSQGQAVTFVRPDQWVHGWQEIDPEEALREVARRYLRAHGPATANDFAYWWGVEPRTIRPLFEQLAPELQEVVVEGKKAWTPADTVALIQALDAPQQVVRLLPNFDPYVVASAEVYRREVIPEAFRERVSRKGAWISPVVLVDGRTVGVWQQEKARKRIVVRVEEFEPLTVVLKEGVEREAHRVGEFLNAPVEVAYGPLTPTAD